MIPHHLVPPGHVAVASRFEQAAGAAPGDGSDDKVTGAGGDQAGVPVWNLSRVYLHFLGEFSLEYTAGSHLL